MKKLLILLASFSFVTPAGMSVLEGFSVSEQNTLSEINENDLTSKYYSSPSILSSDYKGIENVENAGSYEGIKGQITFGFTDKQVDIIKTLIDGTVVSEKFFTVNADNVINAIVGRGTSLVLYNKNNIIKFDFSGESDFISMSTDETFFESSTEESIIDFGKIMTYDEYLGSTGIDSSKVKILPQRNKILSATYRNVKVYQISDEDGSVSISDLDSSSINNLTNDTLDKLDTYYSLFTTGNSKDKTLNFWIAGNKDKKFEVLNLNNGSLNAPTFISMNTGDKIGPSSDSPMFTFDIGKKFGLALKTKVYIWSNDDDKTKYDDTTAEFKFDDSLCIFDSNTMGDKTHISYVTAAKDPSGNDCVLIGTQDHQYVLRSSNKNMGATDDDITLANFDSLDTISNTGTSVATQSYSTAMTNSYGKIYVLDGSGDVHMWQRKVNLNELTPEELKFADSDITDSTSNVEKAKLIRDKIEQGATLAGSATGSYVSVADIVGGLKAQYGQTNIDDISELTKFKMNEGDYTKLSFKASNVAWFTGNDIEFGIGTDTSFDLLVGLLENFEISDAIAFNAKMTEVVDLIQKQVNQKVADLVSKHSDWGDVGITVNTFNYNEAGKNKYLELSTSTNDVAFAIKANSQNGNETKSVKFTNVTKVDLDISKDLSASKSTSWTIGNLSDVLNYEEGSSISTTISSATGIPNNKPDDTNNEEDKLSLKAYDASTGESLDPETLAKYVSVVIEGDQLKVNYTDTRYDGVIDLVVSIDTSKATAANTVSDISIHLTFPVPTPVNWAMIGGIIGGLLGAGLLGFLIFCFIKWWLPIIMTKGPSTRRKSGRSYNRIPQETADANSVRHARQHQVRRASSYNDKDIHRSGIFDREIDVNEKKFKNPNRKNEYLGYELDDEAVVNHWTHEGENAKRPRISFEKKSKVEAHEKEVAAKMKAKKAELEKAAKAKEKEKAKANKK